MYKAIPGNDMNKLLNKFLSFFVEKKDITYQFLIDPYRKLYPLSIMDVKNILDIVNAQLLSSKDYRLNERKFVVVSKRQYSDDLIKEINFFKRLVAYYNINPESAKEGIDNHRIYSGVVEVKSSLS